MKRRYHLHLPAILYSVLVLLVGLIAMRMQNNLLFLIFGLMFAGLVVSGLVSGLMMLGLRIKRIDPPHVSVGEPLIVRYALTNSNRWVPIFNVHIEELPVTEVRSKSGVRPFISFRRDAKRSAAATSSQPSGWQNLMDKAGAWVMHLGPRETVHGEAIFWPSRRGEAQFDRLRISTTFPFGLVKKSVTIEQPQHTLIYPRLHPLRPGVMRSIDTPGPVGTRITQRPGGTDDYFGLREFRENDSVRHIAWKRSAQMDQLVCVERSMPSPPRLRVVLDLTTPTERLRVEAGEPWTARELEERSISLAASILHEAHAAGYEIGLSVLGFGADSPSDPSHALRSNGSRRSERRLAHFAVRRNHWHARRLLAALASIDLDRPRVDTPWLALTESERAGVVVIRPDRVQPISDRFDVTYFTGRQLDRFVVRADR